MKKVYSENCNFVSQNNRSEINFSIKALMFVKYQGFYLNRQFTILHFFKGGYEVQMLKPRFRIMVMLSVSITLVTILFGAVIILMPFTQGVTADEHEIPSGIRLIRKLSAGIKILFDSEQLHRCVINVINNACEAMMEKTEPQTKEYEGVEDKQLIVETGIVDNRLNVRIIDSGPGISQEKLEKVFEPLYSTRSFGTGLGLSIVKQIIEQHKGGIEIKSKPMKGTAITLWLPIN